MDIRKYLSIYINGFLVLCTLLQHVQLINADLCDVTGGQNAVILDITESLGDDTSQRTMPEDLPIEGDTASITLSLSESEASLFHIEGKQLRLNRPLDRDQNDISTIRFEVNCKAKSSSRMKSVPVIIRVADENDNTPTFVGGPYSVSVTESNRVGALVYNRIRAEDIDAGVNGQIVYRLVDVTPQSGSSLFEIKLPHQGGVYLTGGLDYETTTSYQLTIEASDLAFRPSNRRNSTTVLRVNVLDVDDHDPLFDTAATPTPCLQGEVCAEAFEYHSTVVEGSVAGILDIYPGRIHAKDPDLIGAGITYSFQKGSPAPYREYFEINAKTAEIRQVKQVDRSDIKNFQIIIQATEETRRRGRSTIKLLIDVQGVDTSAPKLLVASYSGLVQEGSAIGTPVLHDDGSGEPFRFSVTDADYKEGEPLPNYIFELTTTNFKVSAEGLLVVAHDNLDRDPPSLSVLSFQAIAREDKPGGAASAPLLITVALSDINDNAPRISVYPTVSISAGTEKRLLLNIQAEDLDEGENSRVRYALLDDAGGKFLIDPITGDIISQTELKARQQFQLLIQATDSGGLSGQGYLDVVVSRGPNTNGPIFQKSRYTAAVSESVPFGHHVVTLKATDPEGDIPYFSIVEGPGSDAFEVDTLSGVLTIVAQLDRETIAQYNIVINAEDREGASNTASVVVKVLDVNDETPQFKDLPYTFRVNEGQSQAPVGKVIAMDNDMNSAGKISYSLLEEQPFSVDSATGEIMTTTSLDYEKQQVHYIPVVARDQGLDPLSATATVTVLVNDLNDESPQFVADFYNVTVAEDAAIGSVIATVVAADPDTRPSITYNLLEGNSSLFKVSSDSGRVTLVGGLDYEQQANYTLIIGTEEDQSNEPMSRTRVRVNVADANDEVPVLQTFQTITMPHNAPVGSLLVTASASDDDGTSPNNKISYELSGVVASVYFEIGSETGEIRLRKPVADLDVTEFEVKVTATDGGVPPFSDTTEFVILMLKGFDESVSNVNAAPSLQNQKSPLASAPRFTKDFVAKEVREDIPAGTIVLKIPMVNTSSAIACSILDSNAGDQLRVLVTREDSCALQAMREFDFEKQNSFSLTLVLHPASVSVSSVVYDDLLALSKAMVNLTVIDVNDNAPVFDLEESYIPIQLAENKVVLYVKTEASPGTQVMKLKAYDLDGGDKSVIEYELEPQSNRGNYFSVDKESGRIVTQRPLTNVPSELVPFNLSIIATDKADADGLRQSTQLTVLVPIVEESEAAVLLVDAPKAAVEARAFEIIDIVSQATGHRAQIEHIKRHRGNAGNLTQVWFHLLHSDTLVPVDPQTIYEDKTKGEVIQRLSSISGVRTAMIVSPTELRQRKSGKIEASETESTTQQGIIKVGTAIDFGAAEYVLLGLSCFIIVFVFVAIIVTCILWSRFSKGWKNADKNIMMIPPVVSRSGDSVIDGSSKEYEVQVLHMSVPLDDDSVHEFLPSESPQQYFLDNVSYISKAHTGVDGTSSEGGTSSGRGTPGAVGYQTNINEYPAMMSSTSNDNVLFGRRIDQSPVETTTEL